ncbi:C-type lectin domain family 4 member M-like isoform X1 [Arapaima gigas]
MSERVVYSTVKFKGSDCRDLETHSDVIYSEVKICDPLSTQAALSSENVKTGMRPFPYRLAAVCLTGLCAVLLVVIIVLCVSLKSRKENYSLLFDEKDRLQENYNSLDKGKQQLQDKFNILTDENDWLQENCTTLAKNKDKLQESYNNLDKKFNELQVNFNILNNEMIQLEENCNILTKDKEQLQNKYNVLYKKLPLLYQYCPSFKDVLDKRWTQVYSFASSLCKPCPDDWLRLNSKCYYISKWPQKTWDESKNYCIYHGAHLVIINSEEEKNFIHQHKSSYWIGLTNNEHEGTRYWVDGTPLKEEGFWQYEQPDIWSGNCVLSTVYGWRNERCNKRNNYVCETEALVF